jgi:hypothetical protein
MNRCRSLAECRIIEAHIALCQTNIELLQRDSSLQVARRRKSGDIGLIPWPVNARRRLALWLLHASERFTNRHPRHHCLSSHKIFAATNFCGATPQTFSLEGETESRRLQLIFSLTGRRGFGTLQSLGSHPQMKPPSSSSSSSSGEASDSDSDGGIDALLKATHSEEKSMSTNHEAAQPPRDDTTKLSISRDKESSGVTDQNPELEGCGEASCPWLRGQWKGWSGQDWYDDEPICERKAGERVRVEGLKSEEFNGLLGTLKGGSGGGRYVSSSFSLPHFPLSHPSPPPATQYGHTHGLSHSQSLQHSLTHTLPPSPHAHAHAHAHAHSAFRTHE